MKTKQKRQIGRLAARHGRAPRMAGPATAAAALLLASTTAAQAPKGAEAWASEATVTLVGMVVSIEAAAEATAAGSARVRVEEVVESGESLRGLAGQIVTIDVDPPWPGVGQKAVFFTQGLSIGDEVRLRALSYVHATRPAREAAMARPGREQALERRFHEADLAVWGTVAAVEALPAVGDAGEHDPHWHEAVVAVRGVLKGQPRLDHVRVRFPASIDVAWYRAPKARVGQQAAWALRLDRVSGGYTALDALDVQPIAQVERLRRVMGSAR